MKIEQFQKVQDLFEQLEDAKDDLETLQRAGTGISIIDIIRDKNEEALKKIKAETIELMKKHIQQIKLQLEQI